MRALQPSLLWSLGQIFSFSGNSAAPRGLENSSVLLIEIPGCTWIFHRTKYGYFCHQISNASIFGHKSGHGGADLPVKSTLWTMTVEEQMCWKLLSLIFLSLGKKRGPQWYLEQNFTCCRFGEKGNLRFLMLWCWLTWGHCFVNVQRSDKLHCWMLSGTFPRIRG